MVHIRLRKTGKESLNILKIIPRESYDSVINRMVKEYVDKKVNS